MQYSLCWLAVHGKVTNLILEELTLRRTGDTTDARKAVAGVDLRNGWYVVILNEGIELMQDVLLANMSLECECVACFVDDASKVTSSVGWKHGRLVWRALHDGQKDKENLVLRGQFPALVGPILDNAKAKQKAEGGQHIFNVPLELAHQLAGYRHDRDASYAPFDVLQKVQQQKTGKKH